MLDPLIDDTNEDDAIGGSKPEQNENDEVLHTHMLCIHAYIEPTPVE